MTRFSSPTLSKQPFTNVAAAATITVTLLLCSCTVVETRHADGSSSISVKPSMLESRAVERTGGNYQAHMQKFGDDFSALAAYGFMDAICAGKVNEAYHRTAAHSKSGAKGFARFNAYIQQDWPLNDTAQFEITSSNGGMVTARVATTNGDIRQVTFVTTSVGEEGRTISSIQSSTTFR